MDQQATVLEVLVYDFPSLGQGQTNDPDRVLRSMRSQAASSRVVVDMEEVLET